MNINTHTDHYREKGYCKITYYNTMAKIVPTLGQMTDGGLVLRFAMKNGNSGGLKKWTRYIDNETS